MLTNDVVNFEQRGHGSIRVPNKHMSNCRGWVLNNYSIEKRAKGPGIDTLTCKFHIPDTRLKRKDNTTPHKNLINAHNEQDKLFPSKVLVNSLLVSSTDKDYENNRKTTKITAEQPRKYQ